MGYFSRIALFIVIFSIFISSLQSMAIEPVQGLPLSTRSRWIVDKNGQRVKLACVNWVTHLDPVVAEGLSKQPVDVISNMIKEMGFNCVRFTYPIYLATHDSLASLTVSESFTKFGLLHTLSGIQTHNPTFVNLTLIDAFQAVVGSLGNNNLMVILDNHLSKPGWCCSNFDDNGFFGDEYFSPDLWIKGLSYMATLFKDNPHVVAMSLRNELRGPKQNSYDWFRYMQRGAEAIHQANPNVLVILGGLSYDTELSYLKNQQVNLSFKNKLVFEVHWYSFSNGQSWTKNNANEVCGSVVKSMMDNAGFLLEQDFPLALTEYGIHMVGTNGDDRRYINCVLAWLAEHDLDWALQGTYYIRQGIVDMNETFAILDSSWSKPNNSTLVKRLSLVQSPLRGPGLGEPNKHNIIYHPETGLCVQRNTQKDNTNKPRKLMIESLKLGPCNEADTWNYTEQKTLTLKGTNMGLQAHGLHHLARVSNVKEGKGTRWEEISDSKLHLAAELGVNKTLCMDVDSNNNVITTPCKCLSGDANCDPMNQWFKIVQVSG